MKKLIFCLMGLLVVLVFLITCSPTEPEKAQLSVQPSSFTFTKNTNSGILVIANSGGAELSWEISDKPDWIDLSIENGKITTGKDSVIVTANLNQGVRQYSGAINITSDGGNKEVFVSLNISIWMQKKSMPTARMGLSSCVLDGKVYSIGGTDTKEDPAFKTLEVYDPILNTWATKADLPTERANFATCVFNGKIYAVGGGLSFFWSPRSPIYEYDPVTNNWTQKTVMPRARLGPTASLVNGKIYIIGGADAGEISYSEVDVYDPASDTWTTAADFPNPRFNLAAAVVNDKIYVMGGHKKDYQDWVGLDTVEEYDPATDTWTTKASMIQGRKYITASAMNGRIYVFGGSPGHYGYYLSSVEEYDPATDTWTEKTEMLSVLLGSSSVSYNDKIFVIGGTKAPPPVSTLYEYDPGNDTSE